MSTFMLRRYEKKELPKVIEEKPKAEIKPKAKRGRKPKVKEGDK